VLGVDNSNNSRIFTSVSFALAKTNALKIQMDVALVGAGHVVCMIQA
jgi:hypothetical protein